MPYDKYPDIQTEQRGEIVLYQPNETVRLEVRLEDETVWLNQQQMAELFGTNRQAITKHLKNIYAVEELKKTATCSILELVRKEGKRMVTRKIEFYNLDAIISVGFRVNTKRGIEFRQWANKILKDHLLRGYSYNYQIREIENKINKQQNDIEDIRHTITDHQEKINFFIKTNTPPVEGIFYEGQVFDAYLFASKLIRSARKSIILIDNYIDDSVLTLLDKRDNNVSATVYTKEISKKLQLDINKHNAQYAPVQVKTFKHSHDRFLLTDNKVYHIGASLKDLGKSWFAFTLMHDITVKEITDKIDTN